MPYPLKSVLTMVADELQDPSATRWSLDEQVRYASAGQREIVIYRPDATSTRTTLTCVAGARQSLPANGSKLIDVLCNTVSGKSVRLVSRDLLDAQVPGWRAATAQTDAIHFMYDQREPRVFDVYPPAVAGTTKLETLYAVTPTDLTPPGSVALSAVTGEVAINDIYVNALVDYILFRCFSKDAEQVVYLQRGQAHYALFAQAMGIEAQTKTASQPSATTQ